MPRIRNGVRQEIQEAFDHGDVRPGAGWPRDESSRGKAELALAVSTGAWAVGLATVPPPDSEPLMVCVPREARTVVALWLSGQSTPLAGESLKDRVLGLSSDHHNARPRALTGLDLGMITLWWPLPEAVSALALLQRPPDEVARRLREEWSRWTSPGTPTRDLTEAFGLPPVPIPNVSPAGAQVSGGSDCHPAV